MSNTNFKADVIIVGAGLAGMVAAHEAVQRGRKVLLLDQEAPQSLGGQAFWSLGGLFMVDTPEQRRLGIKDSPELALSDWMGSAQFDRAEDANPRAYAEGFIDWAAGGMRQWCYDLGMRWFPVVGWAERGGEQAHGHGNSVPRFHITWGTGTGVVAPFAKRMTEYAAQGSLQLGFRHRVTDLTTSDGRVTGLRGDILENSTEARGKSTTRDVIGSFEHSADAVVLTTGGIGGNHDVVRKHWPADRLGPAPDVMVAGVPDYVDGKMHEIARQAGAGLINEDRMWHYCEGLQNWDPIWPNHGIRILPGPSSLWFDAKGDRMEAPYLPGFDTLGTLKRILSAGQHSWFILTQKIIEKEFALSGSEQNPDLTDGGWRDVLKARLGKGATPAVEAFKKNGADFIVADDLETLVAGMNRMTPDAPVVLDHIRGQITARDLQLTNPFAKDAQITAIRGARNYRGDKLIRTAKPHAILDPENGPLIAVRLNILTRKSLGGLHTDMQGRVLTPKGDVLEGLYAAGEVCGFGGGGYHGYNALEGTFLGGCLYSGRIAGQNA
ncbi:FAD-binding dehydrogenase [Sulfitobacter mediterraneus]|uniref:FAD-binding dehydrogenase n=1 Tax=Sulfitobacter mediterraneus TaxID=83219 RepID=UPI001933F9BB|nr:FAD-binding dehydrogenase [Sulfitobacter mediterraneus]MBM1634655.1 FAD-binding dehydrogenase [Sulfitobacter mediterraneus]MBM1642473.1 FAD-binding dehydrogenase [Sulfitobacter mediterraneus]MBM1646521.1 FAD-binding dehydrogenase [Sulfitobacter mediterraneus]MBM1650567.1 FAD-binding dehydrogenase [Sulfitobacter mediterraneus]MBM1654589.1 FAD-binding dehydrogenase [Sulfitobacter mediterraneus]